MAGGCSGQDPRDGERDAFVDDSADEIDPIRREMYRHHDLEARESHVSFVAAALWGAWENARLVDRALSTDVYSVLMKTISIRSSIRAQLQKLKGRGLEGRSGNV